MKKIALLALFTLVFTSMFAATVLKPLSLAEELKNDELFISMCKKQSDLMNLVLKSLDYDQQKLDEANAAIEELKVSGISDEESYEQIERIFNLPEDVSFADITKEMHSDWTTLKNKYGEALTDEVIRQAGQEVFETFPPAEMSARPCNDRAGFALCSGAVAAGAMIAHAGCIGTFIGAPLCIAAVIIIEVAGINQCAKEFCGKALTDRS